MYLFLEHTKQGNYPTMRLTELKVEDFDNGVSINVPVIRYAEVILNRAEALAENDQLAEAWTNFRE